MVEDGTCEADRFFFVTLEEVQIDMKQFFSQASLRKALTPKQWEELYNKHKVVIYTNRKMIAFDMQKTRRALERTEQGLLKFPLEELEDHPHHSVVNKWLREKLGIEWTNIPLKLQRKDTMKPELLRFIKERLNVTVSNDRELYQIEVMLTEFERQCKNASDKKEIAALEKRVKDRLKRKKAFLAEKERLRARFELRALELHYIVKDREALMIDLKRLLFP